MGAVKEYSVKIAAVGAGLAAYNGGQAGRADEIRNDLPLGELTSRNKEKITDMLAEHAEGAGDRAKLTGGVAAGAVAAAVAAVAADQQDAPKEKAAPAGKRKVSRREFFGRSAEIASGAVIAAGMGGVLHAAGGGRELNEIVEQLPATLSPPERTAVEQVIYKSADANEQRVDTSERVLTGGVLGLLGGHVLKVMARRNGNDGPER